MAAPQSSCALARTEVGSTTLQTSCVWRPLGVTKRRTMNSVWRFSTGLIFLALHASLWADDWPQWRGPERNGHVAAEGADPAALPTDPKILWRLNIGGGFSSPVVAGGKLAYLDGQDGQEVAHLLDA